MSEQYVVGIVLLLLVVGAGCIFYAHHAGQEVENKRLYQKCILKNLDMPYGKAVAFCKEEVK